MMSAPTPKLKQPILWINAFPGIGKLTITKHLLKFLPTNSNPVLIDNHQLIDPVEAIYPRGHPSYTKERTHVRQAALKKHVEDEESWDRMVIFTDFQTTNERGKETAIDYQVAATRSGRILLPIYLQCSVEENVKRLRSSSRVASGTTKLLDESVLRLFREDSEVFRFAGVEAIDLDVGELEAVDAARRIADEVEKILSRGAGPVKGLV